MSGFEPKYFLMVAFEDGICAPLTLAQGDRLLFAKEGKQHLLLKVGQRLIDDGIIKAYQLAKVVQLPTLAEGIEMPADDLIGGVIKVVH